MGVAIKVAFSHFVCVMCCRLKATFAERGTDVPEDELEDTIDALAYGAVKYADLKNNRMTNYK